MNVDYLVCFFLGYFSARILYKRRTWTPRERFHKQVDKLRKD